MNEILLEELLEKRDYFLYTIKHLEFREIDEKTEENEKLMNITFEELKKIENEIRTLLTYDK